MISRRELSSLTPDELLRVDATIERMVQDKESGRVPWLCPDPQCDGRPHRGRPGAHSRADQRPPTGDEWDVWLALAGRGWGKTRTGAEWAISMARTLERGALVGPTAADTRDILVEGESGIMACAPATFRPIYEPSKRRLTYPNGAQQICYSADEPDRLRGPQHHYGWLDELASWRRLQYAWDMLQLGMRLGDHPRICITTTPRPLPLIKALLKDEMTAVVRGSTYDNLHNLAPTFRRAVVAKYEGTTLGAQELHAVVLDDLPGALWKRADILHRATSISPLPEFRTVTVGMDPAGTGRGDETGLVVVARGIDGRDYVLDDQSEQLSPNRAGNRAFDLRDRWNAATIVVEDNGGKDWIEATLRAVWRDRGNKGPMPVERVNASQGKKLRAQPIAARYEQHRVTHVEEFHELEDQMCTWIPEEDSDSPDRVDALVHAVARHVKLYDRGEAAIAAPHQRGGMRGGAGTMHPLERARQARAIRRRASAG